MESITYKKKLNVQNTKDMRSKYNFEVKEPSVEPLELVKSLIYLYFSNLKITYFSYKFAYLIQQLNCFAGLLSRIKRMLNYKK